MGSLVCPGILLVRTRFFGLQQYRFHSVEVLFGWEKIGSFPNTKQMLLAAEEPVTVGNDGRSPKVFAEFHAGGLLVFLAGFNDGDDAFL